MWGVTAVALLAFTVSPGVLKTPLNIKTVDGIELFAVEYRYEAKAQRPTVILTGDGFEGSGSSAVDRLAEALFLRGLDVVTWDRRGTGRSGGRWDFGHSDEADLFAVAMHIDARTFGHDVGLAGIGTGGVTSLQAAAQTAKIRAVAVYGVGLNGVPATGVIGRLASSPGFAARWLLRLRGIRTANGTVGPRETDLSAVVSRLARRPVLFAMGGRDTRVASQEGHRLFQAALPPKEWAFSPGAGTKPPISEWAPRMEEFFLRRLK